MDKFLAAENGPRDTSDSSIAKVTTEDLFRAWESQSLPHYEHPCRKIVFTIKSHDQGWASEDMIYHKTYQRSYTWFDVGLERLETRDMENDTSAAPVTQIQLRLGPKNDTSETAGSVVCDIRTVQPPVIQNPSNPSDFIIGHPSLPPATRLQSNVTAERQAKEHIITWAYDDCTLPESPEGDALEEVGRGRESATGKFIRNLKTGDIVTIWARARFQGWVNIVEDARIDIYWAV